MSRSSRSHHETSEDEDLIRIAPYHYIHVTDLNSNVTRVVEGPMKYVRSQNEVVVKQVTPMITIPPDHYCVVGNPVVKSEDGSVVTKEHGLAKLLHGDTEVRLSQEPFPLYPGEEMVTSVLKLQMVPPHTALKLEATNNFTDREGVSRRAGDQWLFRGPGLYIPEKECRTVEKVEALTIESHQAIRLKATHDFTDRRGVERVMGQEWLVREPGSFMPDAYETVVETVDGIQLSENTALYIRATQDGTDAYGNSRKMGEEWLVTYRHTNVHMKDVFEEIVRVERVITLSATQYAVILNPFDSETSTSKLGQKKLVLGPCSFFLQPREVLECNQVCDMWFAKENEALLLKAEETHVEHDGTKRMAGDLWLLQTKTSSGYVPPVEVTIVEKRMAMPLEGHEGVYVRNITTGNIRLVHNQVYMLTANEELWEKEIPPSMIQLPIASCRVNLKPQPYLKNPKYWALCYKLPNKCLCKLFDFKRNKYRNKFGPTILMLNPYEEITEMINYTSDAAFAVGKAFRKF